MKAEEFSTPPAHHDALKSLIKLERAKGFEPSTPTLARLCSTPELHPHPLDGGTVRRAYGATIARMQSLPVSADRSDAAPAERRGVLTISPDRQRPRLSSADRHLLAQPVRKRLELGVGDRDQVLFLRIGAGLDVGAEFLERGDALVLKAVELGPEVAVDLGVAGLMAAGIAEHVLGEQILRVAA